MSTSAGLVLLLLGLGLVRVVTQQNLLLQACLPESGTMSEARRDSTSSLQRKKPPWLKLDIPAVVPPAAEDPSFLQVGFWPVGALGIPWSGSSPGLCLPAPAAAGFLAECEYAS